MFSLNETNNFMVYSCSVDLRKGVEPLCGITRNGGRKPSDGSVYVFLNRSRTLMKPRMYVRQEWDAICKPAEAKPTDARTEITEARGSQNCLPGCIAGNSLMAVIVTDKWCNHLPEYRQVKCFAAMGVTLSTTNVNRWQHALASRLFPLYEMQMGLVLSSRYQHVDESTMPINDQKHHTRKGYIWSDVDGMLEYGLVWYPPRDI